jgi:hypothetical protein
MMMFAGTLMRTQETTLSLTAVYIYRPAYYINELIVHNMHICDFHFLSRSNIESGKRMRRDEVAQKMVKNWFSVLTAGF